MFKKQLQLKPQTPLKSSDRRKLQSIVPTELPSKVAQAQFYTQTIKKGTLYLDLATGNPLYFQERDGHLIPSLHNLWTYPESLKWPGSDAEAEAAARASSGANFAWQIIITHQAVIDRLENGADLMIRGCLEPFPGAKKGDIVAVIDYKRPDIVVALGICQMDIQEDIDTMMDKGGVLVKILHVAGDKLCEVGENMDKTVAKRRERLSDEQVWKEMGISLQGEDNESVEIETSTDANVTVAESQLEESEEVAAEDDIEEPPQEEYKLTTEDVDQFFERALLSVLYHTKATPLDVPQKSSQLIPTIQSHLPIAVTFKQSSYKKSPKFLKAMEKEGLLTLKGKDTDLTIITLGYDSSRVENFSPYKLHTSRSSNGESSSIPKITVHALYKPTKPLTPLYKILNLPHETYYTQSEVNSHLQSYVTSKKLAVGPTIKPDELLTKLGLPSTPFPRSTLTTRALQRYSPYHIIDTGSESATGKIQKPKKGAPPKVEVKMERRMNKHVTRVKNIESFGIDNEEFAKFCRKKCKGGAVIMDGDVVVQGKQDLIPILNEWGIKDSWIKK
ncbi:Tma64 protein [Martiniozyma asiatica (nom. inval.)]|nr:Tma64 protein [Martiniozyma asiatica]